MDKKQIKNPTKAQKEILDEAKAAERKFIFGNLAQLAQMAKDEKKDANSKLHWGSQYEQLATNAGKLQAEIRIAQGKRFLQQDISADVEKIRQTAQKVPNVWQRITDGAKQLISDKLKKTIQRVNKWRERMKRQKAEKLKAKGRENTEKAKKELQRTKTPQQQPDHGRGL